MRERFFQGAVVVALPAIALLLPLRVTTRPASPMTNQSQETTWSVSWSEACASGSCKYHYAWQCVWPGAPEPLWDHCDPDSKGC